MPLLKLLLQPPRGPKLLRRHQGVEVVEDGQSLAAILQDNLLRLPTLLAVRRIDAHFGHAAQSLYLLGELVEGGPGLFGELPGSLLRGAKQDMGHHRERLVWCARLACRTWARTCAWTSELAPPSGARTPEAFMAARRCCWASASYE